MIIPDKNNKNIDTAMQILEQAIICIDKSTINHREFTTAFMCVASNVIAQNVDSVERIKQIVALLEEVIIRRYQELNT